MDKAMFGDKDRAIGNLAADEASQSKVTRHISKQNKHNPEEKMGFSEKGFGFLRESDMGSHGFQSKPSKIGNLGSQELTLSYLCDSSKLGFLEKELAGANLLTSLEKESFKGKGIIVSENSNKWVERDFLNLNETRLNCSKRELEEEAKRETRDDKKPKLETLNLSLALPEVSLSLTASNALQNGDHPAMLRPSRSVQSLAPSANNNTQTTCSNDFTAASLSYSYSHQFSHNPSCSLTRNSTDFEYSVGKDDQIWNCGEGTNGSVHSRFKPIGDGVGLSNHGGGILSMMQSNRKDSCNNTSVYRTTSSENLSFFPSELPAKPKIDTLSGGSRGRGSESLRGLEGVDGCGRARKLSTPERILREIVSGSVTVMAQTVQELPEEMLLGTKEYLKNLISAPEKKEELVSLQNRLQRRSDLTKENLSKCQKDQLEILVAVKMGLGNFVSGKNRLPATELVEIFSFMRCKNVNCKSLLPVDDCDCKICSANKGFCSSCMCPVCLNFDCANNTCSWVGCDVCSHWCHAACGIQSNLIKPGPSLKGPSGTTEMQFHCIGCDHASEMFGFVKDVFLCCAKDWGLETLIKELDCVKKIFRRSDDFKGRELHIKAEEIISKLGSQLMSPSDACNFIIQFFNYTDGVSEYPASTISSKELSASQSSLRKDLTPFTQAVSAPPKYAVYSTSSSMQRDSLSNDTRQNPLKSSHISNEDEFQFGTLPKIDGFESLESLVRIKEAEARMFQDKADEARREAEGYRQMIQTKTEKLEEEYAGKFSKLCLKETEEKRRKKLEELKILESSHCDYYKMKTRMQGEIAGLLERMEATKQQRV